MRIVAQTVLPLSALALAGVLSFAACSSSSTGDPGGPVSGPTDAHCGAKSQPTSEAACQPATGAGGGTATSSTTTGAGGGTTGASGSTTGAGGAGDVSDYGETLPNAEGDDDDCKYHVKWTSTDIFENKDVFFTVV